MKNFIHHRKNVIYYRKNVVHRRKNVMYHWKNIIFHRMNPASPFFSFIALFFELSFSISDSIVESATFLDLRYAIQVRFKTTVNSIIINVAW